MRLELATQRAQAAIGAVQRREPGFQPTPIVSGSEPADRIAAQEAIAAEAEARLQDLARGVIPGTNPAWGVNRLREDLRSQGYVLDRPTTDAPGLKFVNPSTGEIVRIMERPSREPRTYDPAAKFQNDYYYRYNAGKGDGQVITIPNKQPWAKLGERAVISAEELKMRILAKLEEVGNDNLAPLMNQVVDGTGDPTELALMQNVLVGLVKAGSARMVIDSDNNRRLVTLSQEESLPIIADLPAWVHFNLKESRWWDRRDGGPPYLYRSPQIALTTAGFERADQVMKVRGYEWWRTPKKGA